jgi:hypothetical protein
MLNRRSLIASGLMGTGALAVAAVPAIAALARGEDARLLQLCRNWHRVKRILDQIICGPLGAAEKAYFALPPLPKPAILLEGFQVWPGDKSHAVTPELWQSDYGPPSHYDGGVPYLHRPQLTHVARGKFRVEARLLPGGDPDDETPIAIPQAARDHAKACLKALDGWEAAAKTPQAMEPEQQNKPDPQPLGGHALSLDLLFPRWLGVFRPLNCPLGKLSSNWTRLKRAIPLLSGLCLALAPVCRRSLRLGSLCFRPNRQREQAGFTRSSMTVSEPFGRGRAEAFHPEAD